MVAARLHRLHVGGNSVKPSYATMSKRRERSNESERHKKSMVSSQRHWRLRGLVLVRIYDMRRERQRTLHFHQDVLEVSALLEEKQTMHT